MPTLPDEMLRLRAERGRAVCSDASLYPQVSGIEYRYEPERCVAVRPPARARPRTVHADVENVTQTRRRNLLALERDLKANARQFHARSTSLQATTATALAAAYAAKNLAKAVRAMRLTQGEPVAMKRALRGFDDSFKDGLLGRPENKGMAAALHAHIAGLLVVLNRDIAY